MPVSPLFLLGKLTGIVGLIGAPYLVATEGLSVESFMLLAGGILFTLRDGLAGFRGYAGPKPVDRTLHNVGMTVGGGIFILSLIVYVLA